MLFQRLTMFVLSLRTPPHRIIFLNLLLTLRSANELIPTDLFEREHVPRFKVRYTDNQFYYPLNFSHGEIPESIDTVILLCLEAISRKSVESNKIAGDYLLFNKEMLYIES